jgi:hypothetical protein
VTGTGMDVQGSVEFRFEPVRQCFAEILGAHAGTGAAFAAWSDGRWVADPQCTGPDLVFGGESKCGLGFGIDDDGYGMGGLGGSYGGASTTGDYTVGFMTGTLGGHGVDLLENTLRDCLGVPPLSAAGQ